MGSINLHPKKTHFSVIPEKKASILVKFEAEQKVNILLIGVAKYIIITALIQYNSFRVQTRDD